MAWYVDGVELDENDKDEISEAATEGAKRLQGCGIYHEDLRYANLRVQRLSIEENREKRWRVWWIDLGRARVVDMGKDKGAAGRSAGWRWKLRTLMSTVLNVG